jgi:hypothetical protein
MRQVRQELYLSLPDDYLIGEPFKRRGFSPRGFIGPIVGPCSLDSRNSLINRH